MSCAICGQRLAAVPPDGDEQVLEAATSHLHACHPASRWLLEPRASLFSHMIFRPVGMGTPDDTAPADGAARPSDHRARVRPASPHRRSSAAYRSANASTPAAIQR